jgi:hypothetical protein
MRNGIIGLAGVLVLASTVTVVGCGSDSDSDDPGPAEAVAPGSCSMTAGGTGVTNLCGAAPLNTLSAMESVQLCNDTSDYIASAIGRATGCKYVGIVAAASNSSPTEEQLQAACSVSEGACNQDATIAGPGANTLCGQIPPTCTATVEQYSACVTDEAELFDQGATELVSCSMLTFGNLSAAYDVPTAASAAPSCMAIKTACPNFSLPYIN